MIVCTTCGQEKEKYHGNKCKECKIKKNKEIKLKKRKSVCEICQKEYLKYRKMNECSMKCYLLKRMKKQNECWIWQGRVNDSGYGKIKKNNMHLLAHRESFKEFKGEIPKGLFILHSCNTPECINPNHLRVGTAKENCQDRSKDKSLNGEKNPSAILTLDQVKEIKKLLANNMRQFEIAKLFNVGRGVIWSIKHKKTWDNP